MVYPTADQLKARESAIQNNSQAYKPPVPKPNPNNPKYQRDTIGNLTEAGRSALKKDEDTFAAQQKAHSKSNQSTTPTMGVPASPEKPLNVEAMNRAAGTGASGGDSTKMPLTIGPGKDGKVEGRDINTGKLVTQNPDGTIDVDDGRSGTTIIGSHGLPMKQQSAIGQSEPTIQQPVIQDITPTGQEPEQEEKKKGFDFSKLGNWLTTAGSAAQAFAHDASLGKVGQRYEDTIAGQQYAAQQQQGRNKETMGIQQQYNLDLVDKNFKNSKEYMELDYSQRKDFEKAMANLRAGDIPRAYEAFKKSGIDLNELATYTQRIEGRSMLDNLFKYLGMLKPFSEGGYTGAGGKNDVAGVVHKGEYVIPKEHVDQETGLPKIYANNEEKHRRLEQLKRWHAENMQTGRQTGMPRRYYLQQKTKRKEAEEAKREEASKNRLREQMAKENSIEGRMKQSSLGMGLASDKRAKTGIKKSGGM